MQLIDNWPWLQKHWLSFLGGGNFAAPTKDADEHEWEKRATTYLRAKCEFDFAKSGFDAAKKDLLALGEGQGHGVQVKETTRRGSIDWQRMAAHLFTTYCFDHDWDADSGDFRKDSTTSLSIKEVKN